MRLIRLVLGLLLMPVCWVAARTVFALLGALPQSGDAFMSPAAVALVGGYLSWVIIFFALPCPVRTYVLAHELTHALWGALMGVEVRDISVSSEHGYVVLSESNVLITLAPYFFPLYTMLLIIAYGVANLFWDLSAYQLGWLALVGFTWGFHFTFTITTLMQRQTDVQEYGRVFSYSIICLFNIAGIALWIVAVTEVSLEQLVALIGEHAVATAVWLQVVVMNLLRGL